MPEIKLTKAADILRKELPPRKRWGNKPIQYDDTPVVCSGEKLSRVLWRGRQWAVTAWGLEALDGNYHIDAKRLAENWPEHITEKVWVDRDDFKTAWLIALALHGTRITPAKILQLLADACDDPVDHSMHL